MRPRSGHLPRIGSKGPILTIGVVYLGSESKLLEQRCKASEVAKRIVTLIALEPDDEWLPATDGLLQEFQAGVAITQTCQNRPHPQRPRASPSEVPLQGTV